MRSLKDSMRPVLFYSGLPHAKMAYRRLAGQRSIFILMYHRVDHQRPPFFEVAVRPDVFEKQIVFLKKHFEIVDLADLNKKDPGRKSGKDFVVLTFDDGYRDNYLHAFPVLRKYQVPATIFLTTGYINSTRLLWYDKLAWILNKAQSFPDAETLAEHDIAPELFEDAGNASLRDVEKRGLILNFLAANLKNNPAKIQEDTLDTLSKVCKLNVWPGESDRAMLSWEEVKEMSGSGISFGCHSCSHPVLSAVSEQEAQMEITGSKKALEDQIQKRVVTFAYPYGKAGDYRKEHIFKILEAEGFEYACSTNRGTEKFPLNHPLELKRKGVTTYPYLFL